MSPNLSLKPPQPPEDFTEELRVQTIWNASQALLNLTELFLQGEDHECPMLDPSINTNRTNRTNLN